MRIRIYDKNDTQEIMKLFYDTVHTVNIRDYTKAQVDAWAPANMDIEVWSRALKSKFTYVAVEDGKIIGFGELEKNGHIDRFYCHQDFQRKGTGTKILEQIESQAKYLEIKTLFAEASITARSFFESQRFIVVKKQEVEHNSQRFINFLMEKII